jgi:hypothetical protein
MKKLIVLGFLFALLLVILTPAVFGVNSGVRNGSVSWADGSVPPPPFPSLLINWNDGSVPPPPFPS